LTHIGRNRLVTPKTSAHGHLNNIQEDLMPTFMLSLNWTDQGIRAVKDSPKRSEDARELAKKVGVEIKHLYLTSGDTDLVIFVDAPSGDNVAKFALAVSSLGNVRTRTARAWSADEYRKLISELP
jgi:uncharacterized protein with GYD domain